MKRKSDPGPDRSPGGFGSMKVRGDYEETLALSSGEGIKSLTVNSSRHVLSKREMVPHPTINFVLTELSEGRTVSELDTYNHSTSRYRRSDSVNVLREIHRRYSKDTELVIQNGLWTLIPVRVSP